MKIFKCIICEKGSFSIICKNCQETFLKPNVIFKDNIISFYKYEEIEFLIKYKYFQFGDRIFKILANNSFKIFAKNFKEKAFVLPIDDKIKKGFSHTAILAYSMKTKFLKPIFYKLHSTNEFKYAGKTLEERLKNPRNFRYTGKSNIDVILVDDIITTGLTINSAIETLKKHNVNVLFSMVLAR